MKTIDQIKERYLSHDSVDFFSAQRTALLCMLPYEDAKPYLESSYIKAYDEGTLPEEERWVENVDINKQILHFLPEAYRSLEASNDMDTMEGLLYLKAWIWAIDEEFHDIVAPMITGDVIDGGKEILDIVSQHFGYEPIIQDVDFEEVEKVVEFVPCNEPIEEPVQEEEAETAPVGEPYTSGTSPDESN